MEKKRLQKEKGRKSLERKTGEQRDTESQSEVTLTKLQNRRLLGQRWKKNPLRLLLQHKSSIQSSTQSISVESFVG